MVFNFWKQLAECVCTAFLSFAFMVVFSSFAIMPVMLHISASRYRQCCITMLQWDPLWLPSSFIPLLNCIVPDTLQVITCRCLWILHTSPHTMRLTKGSLSVCVVWFRYPKQEPSCTAIWRGQGKSGWKGGGLIPGLKRQSRLHTYPGQESPRFCEGWGGSYRCSLQICLPWHCIKRTWKINVPPLEQLLCHHQVCL